MGEIKTRVAVNQGSVESQLDTGKSTFGQPLGVSDADPFGRAAVKDIVEFVAPKIDDVMIEACARVGNDVYAACVEDMPLWADAPDAQKETARAAVRAVLAGTTPEQWHKQWRAEKLDAGWQFGDVKDEELKRHPNLRPYDELPAEQRLFDVVFVAAVKATLAVLDELEVTSYPPRELPINYPPTDKTWRGNLTALFEKRCECRPTNTARTSHSHDCDTGVTDDIRTVLHRVVATEASDLHNSDLRPATLEEVSTAADRLAELIVFGKVKP